MARAYSCDGCGASVETPKVVGSIIKRDYCATCAKNAESFMAAEEDNRSQYRARFSEVRKHLIAVHGQDGEFKLPDVP